MNFSYCFYFPLGNFPRSGFRIFNYLGPSRTEKGLIQNLGSGAFILVYVSLMFTTNIEYHCCNVNHHGNRHKYMRLIVGLNILFSALIFEYRFCAAMVTALPLRVIRRSFNARSVQPKQVFTASPLGMRQYLVSNSTGLQSTLIYIYGMYMAIVM